MSDMFSKIESRLRPMQSSRQQEERHSRPEKKQKRTPSSSPPADSVAGSPAPARPARNNVTEGSGRHAGPSNHRFPSWLTAAADTRSPSSSPEPVTASNSTSSISRSSRLTASAYRNSALSRNISLRHSKIYDSAAENNVDSVAQSPSCSSAIMAQDDIVAQHNTRGALERGFHRFNNFLGRSKAEALQGQTRTGSASGRGPSIRRPSRRQSSSSKTSADTVTPGEYMHIDVDFPGQLEAVASTFFDENMSPHNPAVKQHLVFGGNAARAAAADANSRRKFERRDSNTGIAQLEYTGSYRDSGLNMCSDNEMDFEYIYPRRQSLVKPSNPLAWLPFEVSVQVFGLLDAQDLKSASMVSHAWYNLSSDQHVWKQAFKKSWEPPVRSNQLPLAVGGTGTGKPKRFDQRWSKMYSARQQIEQNWRDGRGMGTYLNGHTDSVYCTQFDENYIYTGSRDRTIRIWDMHTLQCLRVIGIPSALHNDRVHRLTPNPNNTYPGAESPMKCNPNLPGEPDPAIYHTPRIYHDASILCLQLDDEIAITGSSDNTLIMWDVKTWEPIRRLIKHTAGVLDVAFDKQKIVSCSKDSTLCIWDRRTGELLEQIQSHRGPVNAVQLRGQLVVSASGEGCARLWHLNYHTSVHGDASARAVMVKEFWSKDRGLACIEFSDDGKYVLAGGNDMQIFKYDADTGLMTKEMKAHANLVRSLYLDEAGGRIISGSYDSVIRVWDVETGEMRQELLGWTSSWMLSAKSDYRRVVATSQDSRALVLDFGYGVDGAELLLA